MINKNGITTTEENIEKIKNYPIPKTVKEAKKLSWTNKFLSETHSLFLQIMQ